MKIRLPAIVIASSAILLALPLFAAEASFDRNLTVTGRPDLTVATGSGIIHLSPGAPGQIHIVGHIRSSMGGSDDQVHELAAHPPIDQTGNIVRIGLHAGNLHNISIDYEIQAPPDSYLEASTGSGNINDDGLGANAHLSTGSGNIHATGLRGDVTLSTGSGSVYTEFAGKGDVKAETGSGSIELRNLQGGLRAQTGSGHISVGGTPTAPWQIHTGSGGVDFWSGNSAFTLDAECAIGGIHSDREIAAQNNQGKRHLTGTIGGGGPTVHIETGSGSIHIH
jgi:hypothetical protein